MAAIFVNNKTNETFKTVFNDIYINLQKGDEFEHVSQSKEKTSFREAVPSVTTRGVVTKVLWKLNEETQGWNKIFCFDEI